MRLRQVGDQRVGAGGRPAPAPAGAGPCGDRTRAGRSCQPLPCVPGPGTPHHAPASASPSDPRGSSRAPALPSCSPACVWQGPRPAPGKPLEVGNPRAASGRKERAPGGVATERASGHLLFTEAAQTQPGSGHKGPLSARGPAPPGSAPAASRGRAAGRGPAAAPRPVLPRQETLPESSCRLAGQRWSTASRDQGTGGGGRGLGLGRGGLGAGLGGVQ